MSYAALGVVLSMPAIGSLVANVFVARSDGTDRRTLTVGGGFVLAGSMAVFAVATGPVLLGVGGFATGLGATCLVHGAELAIAAAHGDDLERVLARMNLGGTLGDVAGPLVIAATRAGGIDWRWMFAAASAATAVYAIGLARQSFPPPTAIAHADAPHPSVLRIRSVWAIGLAALLTGPLDEPFLATVLAFVERERGASPAAAALIGVAFVFGGVLVYTVLVPQLRGRSPGAVLVATATCLAAATALVLVVHPVVLVVVGVVHSGSLAAQWLTLQALALRVAPGREGRAKALIDTIELGGAIIPIAIGVVADQHGLPWSIACYAALPALLILPAAGLRTPSAGTVSRSGCELEAARGVDGSGRGR